MKSALKTLLITLLFFISCGGEDEPEVEVRKRLIELTEDSTISNYSYNNANMLSGIAFDGGIPKTLIYDSSNRLIQNGVLRYEYNSQGKVSQILKTGIHTTYIEYNLQGKIATIRKVILNSSGTIWYTEIFNLTFNGDKLSQIIEEIDIINPHYKKYTITYGSDNNIAQIVIENSNDNIVYTDYKTYSFTFDNKKNPYYDMKNSIGITESFSAIVVESSLRQSLNRSSRLLAYYCPNNLISYTTSDLSYTKTYEYDEQGYPTASQKDGTSIDPSTGSPFNYTNYGHYTYENY